MTIQPDLLAEILAERDLQDRQWGGPAHDDTHPPIDWIDFIDEQLNKLTDEGGGDRLTPRAEAAPLIRARLIKIIALALAGVQSIDRTSGGPA